MLEVTFETIIYLNAMEAISPVLNPFPFPSILFYSLYNQLWEGRAVKLDNDSSETKVY